MQTRGKGGELGVGGWGDRGHTGEGAIGIVQERGRTTPLSSQPIIHNQDHVTIYDCVQPAIPKMMVDRIVISIWVLIDPLERVCIDKVLQCLAWLFCML